MKTNVKKEKQWRYSGIWLDIQADRIRAHRGSGDVDNAGHLRKLHFNRLKVKRSRAV